MRALVRPCLHVDALTLHPRAPCPPTQTSGSVPFSLHAATGELTVATNLTSQTKRFAATDEDSADLGALTYSLWSRDSEALARFGLHTITSTLTGQTEALLYFKGSTFGALDYETKSLYRVCVNVSDTTGLEAVACTSIAVDNVNEPPSLPEGLVFNLSEGEQFEALLGAVQASGPTPPTRTHAHTHAHAHAHVHASVHGTFHYHFVVCRQGLTPARIFSRPSAQY